MTYLNPQCAKCMVDNGSMVGNSCRAKLAVHECIQRERSIEVIQDLQKMPRDDRGNIKTFISYTNTKYF
jgi:hypothetical protein